jgi:hypothetical protein
MLATLHGFVAVSVGEPINTKQIKHLREKALSLSLFRYRYRSDIVWKQMQYMYVHTETDMCMSTSDAAALGFRV